MNIICENGVKCSSLLSSMRNCCVTFFRTTHTHTPLHGENFAIIHQAITFFICLFDDNANQQKKNFFFTTTEFPASQMQTSVGKARI